MGKNDRIMVDGYYLNNGRGMARYTLNLIAAYESLGYDVKIVRPGFSINFVLWEQCLLPLYAWCFEYKLFIYPYNTAPILAPLKKSRVVIHDLIFWRIKENNVLSFAKLYRKLNLLFVRHRLTKVYTPSFVTQELLQSKLNLESLVVPNVFRYLPSNEQGEVVRSSSKYVLTVSGKGPSKNLSFLEELWNGLSNYDGYLYVVGIDKPSDKRIRYFNNLSDEQLGSLYHGADFYVSASLEEGFGIPLLEASQFDLPLLLSDIPVYKEVCGQNAIYFDANNPNDFIEKLSIIQRIPRMSKEEIINKYSFDALKQILCQND